MDLVLELELKYLYFIKWGLWYYSIHIFSFIFQYFKIWKQGLQCHPFWIKITLLIKTSYLYTVWLTAHFSEAPSLCSSQKTDPLLISLSMLCPLQLRMRLQKRTKNLCIFCLSKEESFFLKILNFKCWSLGHL